METWREDFANTPPFAHLTRWSEHLGGPDWPELATLNRAAAQQNLRNAAGLPVQFTVQSSRYSQHDYEMGIHSTGLVPSRERNWHDLFNALTWLAFPQTKAALNALHCTTLQHGKNRTPTSDAATLFDESGLVLIGDDATLIQLLIERRWREALVDRRADWQQIKAYVFGHAVLEKLLTPWPGITAKCLFVNIPADTALAPLDTAISEIWRQQKISAPASLFPMPVLGIPGWWPANEMAEFYADERVFRPPRRI